jgi:hypothetical protein
VKKRKGGRPFGESTNSGRGLMTSETKPFNGKATMTFKGKSARTNSIANLAGRATKNWSGDPNRTRKKN